MKEEEGGGYRGAIQIYKLSDAAERKRTRDEACHLIMQIMPAFTNCCFLCSLRRRIVLADLASLHAYTPSCFPATFFVHHDAVVQPLLAASSLAQSL
jgi:hypothetical protein